ncbi:MAG: hypothetical protein M5U25_13855 [Planctomycetota bacterium]|nr:hypothetical protein [Planctomycetota bacterium]
MLRAIATAVLLLTAVPCLAEDFDVNALYEKWKKEDSRTLEGWRVLDDPTLIEKLGPLGIRGPWFERGRETGDPAANYLLSIAHERGIAGAPCDPLLARRYWSASAELRKRDGYAATRPYFSVEYREGEFRILQDLALRGVIPVEDLLEQQTKDGVPAAFLMLGRYRNLGEDKDLTSKEGREYLELAARGGCLPAMAILGQRLLRGADVRRDVKGGLAWLKKAAKGGYVPAMLELARFHHYSTGQQPDLQLHRQYIRMAADAGDIDALRIFETLPEQEEEGLKVSELYDRYIAAWRAPKLAISNPASKLLVTPPNPELTRYTELAKWLKPIVDDLTNDYTQEERAKAQVMYAECLRHGIGGVERDTKLSRHWLYQFLHDDNYPDAKLLYAEMLVEAGDSNVREPMSFTQDAYEAGFRPAARMLCAVKLVGLETEYSVRGFDWEREPLFGERQAVQKLEALAKDGDTESMRMLVEYRRIAEIQWLLWAVKLANLGDGPCALLVADYYSEADHADVEKVKLALQIAAKSSATREEALRRLRYFDREYARKRCAELAPELAEVINRDASPKAFLDAHPWIAGFAQQAAMDRADYSLYALCLQYGHGVSADDRSARKLYNLEDEDTSRIYLLARMMEQGYGGAADQRGAGWVYEALAKAGHGAGAYRLGLIRRGEKQDEKATKLFKQAAEAGCLPGMVELAEALHDGLGTEKDAEKAKEWAKKAADAGDASAKALLDEWK